MGCKIYSYRDKMIQIREAEGLFGTSEDPVCLCTFPHNWECGGEGGKKLSPDTVRSMAMLGATVAMVRTNATAFEKKDFILLPNDLPEWIVKEIRFNLPNEFLSRWEQFKRIFKARW